MLFKGSVLHYLTYFSLPYQGEDGPSGNGTIGFPGAPVSCWVFFFCAALKL